MEGSKLRLLSESLELQARIESLSKFIGSKESAFPKLPEDVKVARINQLMAMQTYQQNLDYIIGKTVTSQEMHEFKDFAESQNKKQLEDEAK